MTSYDDLMNAAEVARADPPVLFVEADLEAALKLMEDVGEEHIAVIADAESMKLVGVVDQVAVMLAYNRALERARAEERGEL
jgi:CIC family chloride channel protein